MIEPAIVREYDIRGLAESQLNDLAVVTIATRFASFLHHLGGTSVVVGRDNRISSSRIHATLTRSLLAAGCDVTDIGEATTPILSFARSSWGLAAALMVTGSHNPAEFNGIKFELGDGPLWGDRLHTVVAGKWERQAEASGSLTHREVIAEYVRAASSRVAIERPARVVIDCGNGSAATVAPRLLRAVGCDVRELFCESDGSFPNHHPDPAVSQNLHALVKEVLKTGADLGFAFDGDGNRIGVVAGDGRIVSSDELLAYCAYRFSQREGWPGPVVTEVKTSDAVRDMVFRAGRDLHVSRVGYPHIFSELIRHNGFLAGEGTGHLCLNDPPFQNGDVTYLSAWLATLERSPEDLRDGFGYPLYHTSIEFRIPCPDQEKFQVVNQLGSRLSRLGTPSFIDGVKVRIDGTGWVLIRASNTQPALSVRFEGHKKGDYDFIRLQLTRELQDNDRTRPWLEGAVSDGLI